MIANVLIALIRVYQWTLSRFLRAAFGPVCRFEPSCSRYAVACLEGQGALRGSLLSVKRLCKCHPFHPGGYDPPPPPRPGRRSRREDKPLPASASGLVPAPGLAPILTRETDERTEHRGRGPEPEAAPCSPSSGAPANKFE